MNRSVPAARKLSLTTRLFYGIGAIPFGVKVNGLISLLLLFYNQVVGLPALQVSLAIMVAMIADAVLDPVIGQISDNWRSRWGRRHPFMYAAAIPLTASYLLIWLPPHWSQPALVAYLIVMMIVVRTFITLYEVPSSALAAELTSDFDERTKLLSYRGLFSSVGGLTLNLAAYSIFLKPDRQHPVGQLNPSGYFHYGLAAALTILFAILISAVGTQAQAASVVAPESQKLKPRAMLGEILRTIAHRSFLMVTASALFTSMGYGLQASLTVYFSTYFWAISAAKLSVLTIFIFVAAGLAFVIVPPLSKRFGKKNATIGLTIFSVVSLSTLMSLRLLGLAPENGSPYLMPLLIVQVLTVNTASVGAAMLTGSMIADVVEDSQVRTGRRSEGVFFAALSLIQKAVSGVGIFAAGMVLFLVGFPERARPGHVDPAIIRNLALVYLPILWTLYGASLLFLRGYSITRASHQAALEILADAAESAADGAPEPPILDAPPPWPRPSAVLNPK
jgi:GPH family glycoside/pentoside/hexuronide:cation symporter